MFLKILKYLLWVVLSLFGLILLLTLLLYLPPVQHFIKNKAESYVARNLDMQLSIDRFRLRFPLALTVDNVLLINTEGDSLLRAGHIHARVALWPLFRKQVEVLALSLRETGVHYRDTTSGITLRADLGDFSLGSADIDLNERFVRIDSAGLERVKVGLVLGENRAEERPERSDTAGWQIKASKVTLNTVDFRLLMIPDTAKLLATLQHGTIEGADASLREQNVRVSRILLERGDYAYLSVPSRAQTAQEALPAGSSEPWTIRVGRLEVTESGARYGLLRGNPRPGFDPEHIALSDLSLRIDSVYNRGANVAASIRRLSFRERSGVAVTEANGRFSMDTAQVRLSDFELSTLHSQIRAEALAGASILSMARNAPLEAQLSAGISSGELFLFYPADAKTRRVLRGKTLTMEGNFGGTLNALDLRTLRIGIPGHIALRASGQVRSVLNPTRLSGNVRLNGTFRNLDFLKVLLPDSIRNRIGLPERMELAGNVRMARSAYGADLRLGIDTASLKVKGDLNLNAERYNVRVTLLDFPLYQFLPQDSLGLVTLDLCAAGQGFDPRAEGAASDVGLRIERFDFNRYPYRDIALDAALADHVLTGTLFSDSEALRLCFGLDGELWPEKYAAHLVGSIEKLNLTELHFAKDPLEASFLLDASVMALPDTTYMAEVYIDSTRLTHGYRTEKIDRTALRAQADPRGIAASLRSGDLSLTFNAPESLDTLRKRLTLTAGELKRQIDSMDVDMARMQEALPHFRLEGTAGRNNALYNFLKGSGTTFRKVEVSAATDTSAPFHASVVVDGLRTGKLTLDTLNVWMRRNEKQLNYAIRLANRPGNIETLALLRVRGNVASNRAQMNVLQRDRLDSVGFRFGLDAQLLDSAVRVTMTPENPVLGYVSWSLNPDNYIAYRFNKELSADLRLEAIGRHIHIEDTPMQSIPRGAVRLDMAGIGIANLLALLPAAPPADGKLFSDIAFGMDGDIMAVNGTVGADSLVYREIPVGNVAAKVSFESDSLHQRLLDAELLMDAKPMLTAKGIYVSEGDNNLDFKVSIPSFPLAAANAFLPENAARLEGNLQGDMAITGSTQRMNLDGSLRFAEAQLTVPMIGTSYGIASSPIVFERSNVLFNDFGLTAAGNRSLSIDGNVDIGDFSRISTNLSLFAADFPLVDAPRNRRSDVYGKANADINASVNGPLSALNIRGNIRLLNTTDVYYTLRDSPLEATDNKQDIVTFLSFSDSTAMELLDSVPEIRVWGMNALVNVDIDEGMRVTLNLSENGNDRIELVGEGRLSFVMNPQGDSRFTGRYTLSGGAVIYNPPVISQKHFTVNPGGYVEWRGEIAEPTFNITATETVQTTVTGEDQSTRNVNFDIIVTLKNSLRDMAVTFDLAAPNDPAINNQLLALAPEQRSTQALALLLYNVYTGPGTTARIDRNNPLNSFLENELNRWARNNLKNVDVSFGLQRATDSETGNEHTDFSYSVSKNLFNDRVTVRVGGRVSTNANSQDLAENLVNDISLEYRLNRRDNMFLRIYRYNTRPSVLEGEVVETGVGFITRKRLNNFWDLFRFSRSPERKRLREEEKALKKRQEAAEADPAKEQRQKSPLTETDDDE